MIPHQTQRAETKPSSQRSSASYCVNYFLSASLDSSSSSIEYVPSLTRFPQVFLVATTVTLLPYILARATPSYLCHIYAVIFMFFKKLPYFGWNGDEAASLFRVP